VLALLCLRLLIMSAYAAHCVWTRTPQLADAAANRLTIPPWTMRAIGGLLLGPQAVAAPQVLGPGLTKSQQLQRDQPGQTPCWRSP
jgi:H+/Cl- antiporter ClcA